MPGAVNDAAATAPGGAVLVRMEHIVKRFGDTTVLDDVGFDVRAGEVHALLGGNGAGKSTLMKILAGVHRPDEGRVVIDGEDVTGTSIAERMGHGIAMIYQELSLLPNLSVADNLALGREPLLPGRRVDRRAVRAQAREALDVQGYPMPVDVRVERLTFAQRQVVEIVKATSRGARLLVMDEPTSSLSGREETRLFELIGRLTATGIGIVYISHRMREIFRVADRITVLRDGRASEPMEVADTSLDEVSALLARGATLASGSREVRPAFDDSAVPALRTTGLATDRTLRGVDLRVARGEVVGVAGLVGSGRSTLAKALAGLLPDARGRVEIGGRPVRVGDATAVLGSGLGFVPEDRRLEGLVARHSLLDNVALPNLDRLGRASLYLRRRARPVFERVTAGLSLVARGADQSAAELSGGNQQKVVFAKWLASEPTVLLLDEPTSGVDVGAKGDMRDALLDAVRRTGLGVLLINSELEELVATCDRILIMVDGAIVSEVDPSIGEERLQGMLLDAGHPTATVDDPEPSPRSRT